MPALFSSHNIPRILICKSTKELPDQNPRVGIAKLGSRNPEHSPFRDPFRNFSILNFSFRQTHWDISLT